MHLRIWQFDPARLTPYYDHALCHALAEAGCDVRFITSRYLYDSQLPTSDAYAIDLLYFRLLEYRFLLRRPRLRRVMRGLSYPFGHLKVLWRAYRQHPDIIHIQWSRLPIFDHVLIRALRAMHIPVIHTVHNVTPHSATNAAPESNRRIYEVMDALVVHTEGNRQEFLSLYPGISPSRVHVIPMIDADMHHAELGSLDKPTARARLGLPSESPIILFFGALRYYKGIDLLLDAFERARLIAPEMVLVIAGQYDLTEQALLPPLERLHLTPNLILNEGFIPTADVGLYYTAADLVVHPYRQITQSAALITAMSFGRPVIVSDVGGMREALDGNGWVVSSEDVAQLAAALVNAISDPERLEVMGKRSRDLIASRHSRSAVARHHMAIYQSVMGAKS